MTRVIVTTDTSSAGSIEAARLANFTITLERRLVGGPPLSQPELDAYFSARTTQPEDLYWQYHTPGWGIEKAGGKDLGLVEFCERYDETELWIDPDPNAQLNLIWLLDFISGHEWPALGMKLVQPDFNIGSFFPEELGSWQPQRIDITRDHLATASAAWKAWREPTPQTWFNLHEQDLNVLPQLPRTVLRTLEELPGRMTGLGATEMLMLELIAEGDKRPDDVFAGHAERGRWRMFDYWKAGELLDGLARCPAPAVIGFEEGPFGFEMCNNPERRKRYQQSKLSLTPLGKAILAGADDFTRHNPIDRWWGGTKLTNQRLWRWDHDNKVLIAP
jgi:hypothetical protein